MHIHKDQNWVRVVDGALSRDFCQQLIHKFNQSTAPVTRLTHYQRLWELDLRHDLHRPPKAMDFIRGRAQHRDLYNEDCDLILGAVNSVLAPYREHWDHLHSFPEEYALEGFRIKCYRSGTGDCFPLHTDSGSREMSTRFLAMLFYLNDSDAGTEFPLENLLVEAKQGRVVIFPPGLQWPHRGLEPVQGDKYILSTYLHYQ